jgi:hypothetical protein
MAAETWAAERSLWRRVSVRDGGLTLSMVVVTGPAELPFSQAGRTCQ